jgi:hypothetical protein
MSRPSREAALARGADGPKASGVQCNKSLHLRARRRPVARCHFDQVLPSVYGRERSRADRAKSNACVALRPWGDGACFGNNIRGNSLLGACSQVCS